MYQKPVGKNPAGFFLIHIQIALATNIGGCKGLSRVHRRVAVRSASRIESCNTKRVWRVDRHTSARGSLPWTEFYFGSLSPWSSRQYSRVSLGTANVETAVIRAARRIRRGLGTADSAAWGSTTVGKIFGHHFRRASSNRLADLRICFEYCDSAAGQLDTS